MKIDAEITSDKVTSGDSVVEIPESSNISIEVG